MKQEKGHIAFHIASLLGDDVRLRDADRPYADSILGDTLTLDTYLRLKGSIRTIGVTRRFRDIIDTYKTPSGRTPAGFRIEYELERDGALVADLVRDINYGENGLPRPTGVLFSADCANPYEIRTIKPLIANVTTNPVIIYERFLTNPSANIDNKFETRSQVIGEIARIVGPSADISVELNNPFASSDEILEEVRQFEKLVPKYNLVIKVPHLGPLTGDNLGKLVGGNLEDRYDQVTVDSAFRCHEVALMLHEHGYRVNFTLMFEAYQIALALQAKPSFINCFVRNRYFANEVFSNNLKCFEATQDEKFLADIRTYMLDKNYISPRDAQMSLFEVRRRAQWILHYREWDSNGHNDALDEARAALRQLKAANLPDTRLIICSMAGEQMYALTDRMLTDDEFRDMSDRVIISIAPDHLAQFASSPDVLSYNKGFSVAAQNER